MIAYWKAISRAARQAETDTSSVSKHFEPGKQVPRRSNEERKSDDNHHPQTSHHQQERQGESMREREGEVSAASISPLPRFPPSVVAPSPPPGVPSSHPFVVPSSHPFVSISNQFPSSPLLPGAGEAERQKRAKTPFQGWDPDDADQVCLRVGW